MKLSVIIPAYNHLADILVCINSLKAFSVTTDWETIVQDDASPEYIGPMVIPPGIAVCQRNEHNLGFGQNCNSGAARAHGDVLLFVNQDVFAVPGWSNGWDSILLSAFADASIGIVGPRLLFLNLSVQSAGGLFDAHGQPFHPCLGYSNPHHPDVSTPKVVSWVTGAALAVRRELFYAVGGFDPVYKAYFEDVDLSMKVREAGFKVWYEPRATLIHQTGSTGGSPYFMQSAQTFKQRWVDTGKIQQDSYAVKERFW